MQSHMPNPIHSRTSILALAAAVTALLGGCGGATKTVSVASSPTSSQTTSAPRPSTSTATTPSTSTTGTTPSGATTAPSRTRTAPAPAFTEKGESTTSEGLPAALAVVRAHGYTAEDTSDYHPDQTLRVLVATGTRSNDGYDKLAFFFVDDRYIGNDSKQPSAQLSVVSQSDTEVTLAYALYRPGNPLCCPGGGQAQVRFQLNNGQLTALDPIPPVNSTTEPSRQ
jgi:hypothetical protein